MRSLSLEGWREPAASSMLRVLGEGIQGSTKIIEGYEGPAGGVSDGGGPKFSNLPTPKLGVGI